MLKANTGVRLLATIVLVLAVGWTVAGSSATESATFCEPLQVKIESGQAVDLAPADCSNSLLNQTDGNGGDDDSSGEKTYVFSLDECDGAPGNCLRP